MSRVAARTVFTDPVHFLAFGFGAGLVPKGPGTAGTLVAVPLWLLLTQLPLMLQSIVVLLSIVAGVFICGISAKRLGVHDHPGIVWDEFAGYFLTMWLLPPGIIWLAVGFVLFRVFDIAKPWPIRLADQRVHSGAGIMLDDLLAAVFAAASGQAGWWLWQYFNV